MTTTTPDIPGAAQAPAPTAARLRAAFDRREFVLHYQPKMDARSRSITGLEALMRWNVPEQGLVDPARFMDALESTPLMVEVGFWAMKQALADLRQWREFGAKMRVAVNVANIQLYDSRFVELVRQAQAEAGIPDGLDLEVTEDGLTRHLDGVMRTLNGLRDLGVRVAVDHFGSSRSALPYVARMALDSVKVDGVFVDGALKDGGTRTVLGALIGLAHGLGLSVIAKGVESEEQWKLLRGLHCDEVQGYLFSPARPAANITRMLQVQSAPRRFLQLRRSG
jgi:EAL domain-containing protein (putative c-di-GMP-specific phosphodiesterase class I)